MNLSVYTFSLNVQSDADYWLLSDADVSITDMWRTERILHKMLPHNFLCLHFLSISFLVTFAMKLEFLNPFNSSWG